MNGFDKQVTLKGATYFDGNIDGQQVQSGTFFVEEELDQSKGNAAGFRTVEYKTEMEIAKALINTSKGQFPMQANCHFGIRTSKRAQSIVIENVKPIDLKPIK